MGQKELDALEVGWLWHGRQLDVNNGHETIGFNTHTPLLGNSLKYEIVDHIHSKSWIGSSN